MGIALSGCSSVFLDTTPFIYLFEDHPDFGKPVASFLRSCSEKNITIVSSMITYIELLTLPARENKMELVKQYHMLLTESPEITLLPIDLPPAREAVRLRADYGMKTADALQIAAAVCHGADLIVTNDKTWQRLPGLPIVLVEELYR